MRSSRLYRSAGSFIASHTPTDALAGNVRLVSLAPSTSLAASGSSTAKRGYAQRQPPAAHTRPLRAAAPHLSGHDDDLEAQRRAEMEPTKAKKYSKGVFKGAFYDDPADDIPSADFLATRLRAVLNPSSSSSREGPQVNAMQVLDASHPCTTSPRWRPILEPHAAEICQIISEHFTSGSTGPVLPAVQKAASEVLSLCFVQTAENQFDGRTSYHDPKSLQKTDRTAEAYAQYVLHQALTGARQSEDLGRLNTLLEGLEQGLSYYQRNGHGYRIPAPLVAALAVLRTKLNITETPRLAFIWPRTETVTRYIDCFAAAHNLPEESYVQGLATLMGARVPELPVTLELFNHKLRHTVQTGSEDAIIEIWRQVRDNIGSTNHDKPMPDWLANETDRARALQSMLRAIRAQTFGGLPPVEPKRLERASDELLSLLPRPLPADVLHTLVANRARVVGVAPGMESGSDVAELDREEKDDQFDKFDRQAKALKLLHETWRLANEPGVVRDVKLYMLYMEGLGRLGDSATLKRTWNQMVQDKQCRELYISEGAIDEGEVQTTAPLQYPPTRALNQMIQSALLIPQSLGGESTGLELFRQASLPNSAIKCNIWTINIMLRHYARSSDLASMQMLMHTAGNLGLKPDLVTYATLVQGFLRANQLEMAKATLDTMTKEGFEPNERICTILIADLARTGTKSGLEGAEEVMKEMQRRKFHVGVITWTALISGYFRGGWEEDGWDAVRRMEDSGNKLGRPGYNTLLVRAGAVVAFDKHARPNSMRLFEKMVREGVLPNSDTYLIVLTPLVKAKWWSETDRVVAVMDQLRFTPEKGALKELLKKIKFRRDYNWETPRQREKRLEQEDARRRSRF